MKDKILKLFEDANKGYPGSFSRVGINPSNSSGLISRCPSIPLQGTNAIHEEEAAPESAIEPLQLDDLTIQGYFAIEQGKPTLVRYKLIKNNVPMPVDSDKKNSKNIGHTKEQILKKISLSKNKNKYVKKFIAYFKNNENALKSKQQEKVV
jgi:hypothetical protein